MADKRDKTLILERPEDAARDLALVHRMAAGDKKALEEFWKVHGERALGRATGMMKNRADAEEVVQEAMIDAFDDAGTYREGTVTVRGWFLSIVRNRAVDMIRKKKTARHYEQEAAREAAAERKVEDTAYVRELRRTMQKAWVELSDEQREAIDLSFEQGVRRRELATRLGVPAGTAASRVRTGFEKMRERIEEAFGEGSPLAGVVEREDAGEDEGDEGGAWRGGGRGAGAGDGGGEGEDE